MMSRQRASRIAAPKMVATMLTDRVGSAIGACQGCPDGLLYLAFNPDRQSEIFDGEIELIDNAAIAIAADDGLWRGSVLKVGRTDGGGLKGFDNGLGGGLVVKLQADRADMSPRCWVVVGHTGFRHGRSSRKSRRHRFPSDATPACRY